MTESFPSAPLPPGLPGRAPSGLFPSGPSRPTYREPHRVRPSGVLAGLAAGVLWLLAFGLLAADLRAYAWWTLFAGLLAWGTAYLLARMGDRGVAAGVAIAVGFGWAIAAVAVASRWASTGDWPMW